jgi:hypothetical protein
MLKFPPYTQLNIPFFISQTNPLLKFYLVYEIKGRFPETNAARIAVHRHIHDKTIKIQPSLQKIIKLLVYGQNLLHFCIQLM